MTTNQRPTKLSIDGAEKVESVTALLSLLLKKQYKKANKHGGMRVIRTILEHNALLTVPVVDLVAVLPNLESRKLKGLHIASYRRHNSGDDWYQQFLKEFFSFGVGGSLLALKGFTTWVGQAHIKYTSAQSPRTEPSPPKTDMVTESDEFTPTPETVTYSVKTRFEEYAQLLLKHFDHPAIAVWVCFGPGRKSPLQWRGSLFLVAQPAGRAELAAAALSGAIENVYSVIDSAFHRTIVESERQEEEAHRLQLTYFTFGHDLKHRIARVGLPNLKKKLLAYAPALLPDVDQCNEHLQVLAGMCGVFEAVATIKDHQLPKSWIGDAEGPGSLGYVPTQRDRTILRSALIDAVTKIVYLEDPDHHLNLRQLERGAATPVKRPDTFRAVVLPPFNDQNGEPHLCFLSGLAELCRNAARAALSAKSRLRACHVDFSVDVSDGLIATVLIYNPLANSTFRPSESVLLIAELFKQLTEAVRIIPAKPVDTTYEHDLTGTTYAESRFVYTPCKLKFEGL